MPEILLTGFQPYGGRQLNPSAEVVRALDGTQIGGCTVRGMLLPVSLRCGTAAAGRRNLAASSGLGRLDRPLARRAGHPARKSGRQSGQLRDARQRWAAPLDDSVDQEGPVARAVTLPVGKIIESLREKGIPARTSDTAGTFLCNTTLYRALGACERLGIGARCGFIHVPYLPQQVAQLLNDLSNEGRLELHQRADLASMSLDMMLDAVRTTLALSLEQG